MTKIAIAISALIFAAVSFWLWRVMPDQGWVVYGENGWKLVGEGWATLWRGWPLALLGLVAGGIASLTFFGFILERLVDEDKADEIKRLEKQLTEARLAKLNAFKTARTELDNEFQQARQIKQDGEQRHQQALELKTEAEALQAEAMREKEKALKSVSSAKKETLQAAHRARNAICAAERIKRKAQGISRISVIRS